MRERGEHACREPAMLGVVCCAPGKQQPDSRSAMAPKPAIREGAPTDGDWIPAEHASPRKPKRSPQKVSRKRPHSPDPAAQPNGDNYAYGDPRVDSLSQLTDAAIEVHSDRPQPSVRCVSPIFLGASVSLRNLPPLQWPSDTREHGRAPDSLLGQAGARPCQV